MDFRSRGTQVPTTASASSAGSNYSAPSNGNASNSGNSKFTSWLQRGSVVLLFSVTVLLAALALFLYSGGSNPARAIKQDKYQAVFLNNGQVYFGHINELGNKYLNLGSIYYLQTSSTDSSQATSTPSNVTLVKLGCELHGPYDQMIINNDQVLFWENLQDSSQVVSKIKEAQKSNPQNNCSAASSNSTQQAPSTNSGSSSSSSSQATTPQSTTTTKKP